MKLAKKMGEICKGDTTKLYSKYTFAWRELESELKDDFARNAWTFFQTHPERLY